MLFEEGSACLLVNLKLMVLDDLLDSLSTKHVLLTFLNVSNEQSFVPVKTELVHGVNLTQIIENEEENGSLLTALSVDFSSVINLLHHDLGCFKRVLDFVRFLFRLLECIDESHILKNVDL